MPLGSKPPALCSRLPNLFAHASELLHMLFPLPREYAVQRPLMSQSLLKYPLFWKIFTNTACLLWPTSSRLRCLPFLWSPLASLRAVITLYCDHCFVCVFFSPFSPPGHKLLEGRHKVSIPNMA